MTKPLSPADVKKARENGTHLPDFVVEVVNELILAKWDGHRAYVLQEDIIDGLTVRYTREEVFANKFLDFEPLFRKRGWKVLYDKPAYNESYPASFTFTEYK